MKWFGKIGYALDTEVSPGIWEHNVIEREHFGDVLSFRRNEQPGNEIVEGITLTNKISILADPFAESSIESMLYLTFMGTKWNITNIDVEYPRLIISLGGVYHGN